MFWSAFVFNNKLWGVLTASKDYNVSQQLQLTAGLIPYASWAQLGFLNKRCNEVFSPYPNFQLVWQHSFHLMMSAS